MCVSIDCEDVATTPMVVEDDEGFVKHGPRLRMLCEGDVKRGPFPSGADPHCAVCEEDRSGGAVTDEDMMDH